MANEGEFPKVPGDIAYASEINELSPARKYGDLFKNVSQLLFNSAYIGFNSKLNAATAIPDLKNIKYDVFLTDTASTKTEFIYNTTDDLYETEVEGVVDEFEDASLDSTIWDTTLTTGASVTETGGYVQVQAGGGTSRSAKLTTKNDIFTTFGTYFRIYISTFVLDINNGTLIIRLTDGTDSQTLYASPLGGTTAKYISFYKSGNNVFYKIDEGAWTSADISSISPAKLEFIASTGAGSATNYMRVEWVRVLAAGTSTLIFQTSSLATITDCIATWNSIIQPTNTLVVSISADGTNYETVTEETIHRFTNTGTNLYVKFEIDRVDTTAIDKISEYSILYNTGAA